MRNVEENVENSATKPSRSSEWDARTGSDCDVLVQQVPHDRPERVRYRYPFHHCEFHPPCIPPYICFCWLKLQSMTKRINMLGDAFFATRFCCIEASFSIGSCRHACLPKKVPCSHEISFSLSLSLSDVWRHARLDAQAHLI